MLNANMNDGKSLVIILVSDTSGCSHIRLRHNALWYCGHEHFGFTPVITPIPIFDPMYLARTKAIVIHILQITHKNNPFLTNISI